MYSSTVMIIITNIQIVCNYVYFERVMRRQWEVWGEKFSRNNQPRAEANFFGNCAMFVCSLIYAFHSSENM